MALRVNTQHTAVRSLTAQRWSVSVNSWSRQSRIPAELGTAKLKYRNWPEIRVRVRVKPDLEVWSLVDGGRGAPLGFRPDRGRWGFRFLLRCDVRSPTLRPRQMTLSLILGKFE